MVDTNELRAAVREALLASTPETEQQIWNAYFFGPNVGTEDAWPNREFDRICAAAA